jgi:tripeptide aminopeptidase
VHAIKAAADAISKLIMGHTDEETTLNIGTINGGTATNIVPDECSLSGEIRSFSTSKAWDTAKAVEEQFRSSSAALGTGMDFDIHAVCEAFETPLEHPIIKRMEAACKKLDLQFLPESTFGGSDNNIFAGKGITGIVLASAMNKCHSTEEYTTVRELERIAELTLSLMTDDLSSDEAK